MCIPLLIKPGTYCLRQMVRFPSYIDFNRCREEIASALNDLVFHNRSNQALIVFDKWSDYLPISTPTDVGKKLHLHKMILVIDGVNERVLSVMF